MIIGYINIKDNVADIKNKYQAVKDHAQMNGSILETIYSLPDIEPLKDDILKNGDTLIVDSIASLGSSLSDIGNNLKFFIEHNITFMAVKEGYCFLPDKKSRILLQGFNLAVDIRKNMISQTTSSALSARKKAGLRVGNIKGCKLKRKLSGREKEIAKMASAGLSKNKIAEALGVCRTTLYKFIQNNPEIQERALCRN